MNELITRVHWSKTRKTVALKVKPNEVILYAPKGVDEQFLKEWVSSKSTWINEKKYQIRSTLTVPAQRDEVLVFGQKYRLIFGSESDVIDHKGGVVLLRSKEFDDAKVTLYSLFTEELIKLLESLLPEMALNMGAHYRIIKVRPYKSRWGSFSSNGTIAFNTFLLGAPKYVIKYVMVHELSHYFHQNHSKAFWDKVCEHCKDVKESKQYLKLNQQNLMF